MLFDVAKTSVIKEEITNFYYNFSSNVKGVGLKTVHVPNQL